MQKKGPVAVRVILIVLVVLLMVLIFCLSADTADESNAKSDPISESFIDVILSRFDLSDEQREKIVNGMVFVVRKSAHFCEYALLGCLVGATCISFGKGFGATYIVAQITASLYAVGDEIHQHFVPGRSCQISDMLLDSCGAFAGIMFLFIVVLIYGRIKRKNKKASEEPVSKNKT